MYFKLALGNVKKSFRDYGVYFLTLVFGVCVFYAFNSIGAQNAVLEMNQGQLKILELLSSIVNGVSVFIAVVLGFLIVYASRYLIRRRKKEFGTYLTLGMPTGKVSQIIVYETLFVGLISLVVGLLLGVGISQVLLYVSAAMFSVTVNDFMFIFSAPAMLKTVAYFGLMFLVTLLFNVVAVSRYKLIDLINASRKNEAAKLRNLPLSVVLFIVSLVLIGASYYLLIKNGMFSLDDTFAWATLLVCVGTVLFFFSLSGFLLRGIQSGKKLYFRGLNMFTLRQLNSKINTTFISISVVSMALFLAITSACGGTAVADAFNSNLEANTLYDVTMDVRYGGQAGIDRTAPTKDSSADWLLDAQADGFDMIAGLKRGVSNWDGLVKHAAQTDIYESGLNFGDIVEQGGLRVDDSTSYYEYWQELPLLMVSATDFNEQRALVGRDPITVHSGHYLLWGNSSEIEKIFEDYLEGDASLKLLGKTLTPATRELQTLALRTTGSPQSVGIAVVPDEMIVENTPLRMSVLNVMYKGERNEMEAQFLAALQESYPNKVVDDVIQTSWPWEGETTAVQTISDASGITVLVSYLAIYIGFILLIACAAILALQQLSEAADNLPRYRLLQEIGAERRMISGALFTQIAIYFLAPLLIAFCHSAVAFSVFTNVVEAFGHLSIGVALIATVGIFLLLYGAYFLFTFFSSRNMLGQKG